MKSLSLLSAIVLLLTGPACLVLADSTAVDSTPVSDDHAEETSVSDVDHEFWSFRRLQRTELPDASGSDWPRNELDRFVLAKHQEHGLQGAPSADRRVFVRRAALDLLGLPPSPEEVDAFVDDADLNAKEKLIDRLLQSPHYGERQARHWIDVARFAESSGFEHDSDRPNAWHYRDFLIEAFNHDIPWDEMVRWQIAGDELAPANPLAVKATGFLAAGVFPTQLTEGEFEQARYDELDDMLGTLGVAFLGLSTGCARCHDHKFDPIPTQDYYRMAAVFGATIRSEQPVQVNPAVFQDRRTAWEQRRAELQSAVEQASSENDKTSRQRELDEHLLQEPVEGKLPALICSEGVEPLKHAADGRGYPHRYPEVFYLNRGDVKLKQGVAEPAYLQVLTLPAAPGSPVPAKPSPGQDRAHSGLTYRRTALARWLTDHEYGAGHLLARVIVNRVWQQHFGRGIVGTPNDFGMQGDRPTHPLLLDWLAEDLIAHGWKLKRLHRLIMTSATYGQQSIDDASLSSRDSENAFLWRYPSRRLEAEAIRDSLLKVSGQLDATIYGPGSLSESMRRRSIYFTIKRSKPIPLMQVFDWPEHLVSIGRRATTTIAPQALALMNGPQVRAYAESFARRISSVSGGSRAETVVSAYRIAYGREPSPEESRRAISFISEQAQKYRDASVSPDVALTDFCHTLMCSNEFLHLP